ncbi:cobalamin biosynthesis protein [Hoyosella subflava]|uniref:cobalamin biosynthesis protein n=1 Tax=Hoyosella subflava TaxID=639313 RepID=UPI00059D8599|nr:cobalamin biosynthesis protein [Hoyosella subflava]
MVVRAAGIALGYWADRIFADPHRYHPVAGFGQVAAQLERLIYRDDRVVGVFYAAALAGGSYVAAGWVDRRLTHNPARIAALALVTWATLGGTSLDRVGEDMARRLDASDLTGARNLLPSLCGRDPQLLDADGLARAAVESVAENTSDAAVGPVVYALLLGTPGVVAYRAINTLDAMVGYKSPRYVLFGWASARLDDLANLLPARVSGAATVAAAWSAGGDPEAAIRVWRRDARSHPSPNAGVAESAMAGALGIQLGGVTPYRHGTEIRPLLGSGPAPSVKDLRRAVQLSRRVQTVTVVAAVSAALAVAAGEFFFRRS